VSRDYVHELFEISRPLSLATEQRQEGSRGVSGAMSSMPVADAMGRFDALDSGVQASASTAAAGPDAFAHKAHPADCRAEVEAQFRSRIAAINQCTALTAPPSRAATPRSSSPTMLSEHFKAVVAERDTLHRTLGVLKRDLDKERTLHQQNSHALSSLKVLRVIYMCICVNKYICKCVCLHIDLGICLCVLSHTVAQSDVYVCVSQTEVERERQEHKERLAVLEQRVVALFDDKHRLHLENEALLLKNQRCKQHYKEHDRYLCMYG
jgi:hypothetical protein